MHKHITDKLTPYSEFPRITRIEDLPPLKAIGLTELPELFNSDIELDRALNLADTKQFIDLHRGTL